MKIKIDPLGEIVYITVTKNLTEITKMEVDYPVLIESDEVIFLEPPHHSRKTFGVNAEKIQPTVQDHDPCEQLCFEFLTE
jgi:uncharacterized protein YuzE